MLRGTALLSAYRKDERLLDFARGLVNLGWKLLASKGTREFLNRHNVSSTDISDMVGDPILDHRVVTLDRKIYAAILARLDRPEDMAELKRMGVNPIHLVYVDLYPLQEALGKPDRTFESVLEMVDIGGPTLLRAAAKGMRYVVYSPHQFNDLLAYLQYTDRPGGLHQIYLARLAANAEAKVDEYVCTAQGFYEAVAMTQFPIR